MYNFKPSLWHILNGQLILHINISVLMYTIIGSSIQQEKLFICPMELKNKNVVFE